MSNSDERDLEVGEGGACGCVWVGGGGLVAKVPDDRLSGQGKKV